MWLWILRIVLCICSWVVVVSGCGLDFATGATFQSLVSHDRYTVLYAYNPQGRWLDSQLSAIFNFSSTSRALYGDRTDGMVRYCPSVVLADGVSFDPSQEKPFRKIESAVGAIERNADGSVLGTVHEVQALGLEVIPAIALLRSGRVVEVWNADVSSYELMHLFRAAVDQGLERSSGMLPSEVDILAAATDPNRLYKTALILPNFMRVNEAIRRDVYSVGASILRPSKGSTGSRVLFADKTNPGRVHVYAIGPVDSLRATNGLTEDVRDADWIPSQWSRRLFEGNLTLVRGLVHKTIEFPLGTDDPEDGRLIAALMVPSVLSGDRNLLALSAARRRSACVVTLFLKDLTDEVSEVYRGRLAKVSDSPVNVTAPTGGVLGDRCTFIVVDADIHSRYFTSFGFMFKSLYRSAQDTRGRPSTSLLPQCRQRYSDNLVGVEYNGRRFQYRDTSFNVPLLSQFVRRVLSGHVVRTRKCEQFRGATNDVVRPLNQLYSPFTDCDTLYYEGLRDFRRDTLVIALPDPSMRSCLRCDDHGEVCSWNISECTQWEREGGVLNGFMKSIQHSASKELGVFYYVPTENDLNPYLRLPAMGNTSVQLIFLHRDDKLSFIKAQSAFQPGVHDLHVTGLDVKVRAGTIALPPKGPVNYAVERLRLFTKESSDSLSAHISDGAFGIYLQTDDDEDEF